jgi:hypothetical protein
LGRNSFLKKLKPLTASKNDDFESWIRSKHNARPFFIGGHKFEKSANGLIIIDKAAFDLEEAVDVGHMLLSINPVSRLSAQLAIWEKNGTLVKGVLVVAILLLILVILFLRR